MIKLLSGLTSVTFFPIRWRSMMQLVANKRWVRLSTNDYRAGEVIDADEWYGLSLMHQRALINQQLVRVDTTNLAPKIRCNRAALKILGRTYAVGKVISMAIWQRVRVRNQRWMINNKTVVEDFKNGYQITPPGQK